jgi:predicted DNA-binding protein YlxM (UPF0122 family)
MPKKKKTKSTVNDANLEQHLWKEVILQPELFASVIDIPDASDEEIAVIKDAKLLISELLFDRVVELATHHFTKHQNIVLALIQAPDRTYNEIAEIIGINYTGVSHAIKGIKSPKHSKFHGGYEKKLRKICQKDKECTEYIDCIRELRNNDPEYAIQVLIRYDDNPEFWQNYREDQLY